MLPDCKCQWRKGLLTNSDSAAEEASLWCPLCLSHTPHLRFPKPTDRDLHSKHLLGTGRRTETRDERGLQGPSSRRDAVHTDRVSALRPALRPEIRVAPAKLGPADAQLELSSMQSLSVIPPSL